MNATAASIPYHFRNISDPRIERNKLHSLEEIFVVTICAVICGMDNWVAIEEFARDEEEWFRTILPLPNGIASHDTLSRVFGLLDPEILSHCFVSWMKSVITLVPGSIVALDGKTARRSASPASGKKAIHMLSAYAAGYGLVLGQRKTEEKSNEITAIPKLLQDLSISGCIVTIDAMGCQTEIAKTIIEVGADYVLQVKGNQKSLHEDLQTLEQEFDSATFFEEVDGDHGRVETRRTTVLPVLEGLEHLKERWHNLNSLVRVHALREQGDQRQEEYRYYISSLIPEDPKTIARAVRRHWSIENELHWVLDIAFREDENRTRESHAAENLVMMRHISLNLLKSETGYNKSIPLKRQKAARNRDYRKKVLASLNG
jgi:predicted transposase YbfD/YdcC